MKPKPRNGFSQWTGSTPAVSLSGRLMLVIALICLVGFLIIGLGVAIFIFRLEIAFWQKNQTETAQKAAYLVSNYLQRGQVLLRGVALFGEDEITQEPQTLYQFLANEPEFLEFIYLDQAGYLKAQVYVDRPVLFKDQLVVKPGELIQSWEERSADLFLWRDGQVLYLIRALSLENGGLLAVRAQIDLNRILVEADRGKNERVFLVDHTGEVITHSQIRSGLASPSFTGLAQFEQMRQAADHRWQGEYTSLLGDRVVGASTAIEGTDWLVVAEMPQESAYATSRIALLSLAAGLSAIALLAVFAQRQLFDRMLVQPLQQLIEGARRFGMGEFERKIPIERTDEIGQLATALNSMATQLRSRENELNANRDALLEEVQERRAIEEALRQSEARYRLIAENTRDVIWISDLDLNLLYISPSFEKLRGDKVEDLLSHKLFEFFTPASGERLAPLVTEFVKSAVANPADPNHQDLAVEVEAIRKGGATAWTETSMSAFLDERGQMVGVIGATRNIQKRKETEEALRSAYETLEQRVTERTRQLSAVNQRLAEKLVEHQQAETLLKMQSEILQRKTYQQEKLIETARQLTTSLNMHDVLRRIAQGATDILDGFGCVIYLLEGDHRTLLPVVAIDPLYEEEIMRTWLDIDSSLNGQVVKERCGMIFNHPLNIDIHHQIPGTTVDPTERLIAAPLIVDDQILGSLCINRMGSDFTEEDLALAETFAAYASSVFKIAQSHDKLQREVEERRRAEESLRESEERYMLATQGANDGLWDWDLRQNQIYLSTRWKSMLGYTEAEIGTGINEWFDRVHEDDLETVKANLSRHLHGLTPHFESEYRMLHKDGSYRWIQTRGLAVRESGVQSPYRMAGSQSDITARKKAEEQLLHDAFHDSLTRLPNRALFLDRLGHAIERTSRHIETTFAVLFLDLDRFKIINDSLGHFIGDQLLIAFAQRLSACLRSSDTAARLGGDEFVVLLEDIQGIRDATRTTERIIQSLKAPFQLDQQEMVVTASIGIVLGVAATGLVSYQNPEDVLRDADIAMYRAKSQGKNCFVIFDTSQRARAITRLEMENELRAGLERGEFQLNYQPICLLSNDHITGFEALLRWNSPSRGLVAPSEFIPVAEETGLIVPIGEWVVREACRQICKWQQLFPQVPPLSINVNISGVQFAHPALLEQVQAILEETGLAPDCLKLEITESVFMENAQHANATLIQLRQMGVNLQIDDFGTGYSSLAYLQHFPIDAIKIDQSFIRHIDARNGDTSGGIEIIRTIIALARDLGMESVAEGVETLDQLTQLKGLDCQYGQGFFLGSPLAPEVVEVRLAQVLRQPEPPPDH